MRVLKTVLTSRKLFHVGRDGDARCAGQLRPALCHDRCDIQHEPDDLGYWAWGCPCASSASTKRVFRI